MNNIKETIVELKLKNPCESNQKIGDRLGVTREYVRQVLNSKGIATRRIRQRFACLNCGQEIPIEYIRFCNSQCRENYYLISIVCDYCGNMFQRKQNAIIPYPSRLQGKKHEHNYCSIQCTHNARSK